MREMILFFFYNCWSISLKILIWAHHHTSAPVGVFVWFLDVFKALNGIGNFWIRLAIFSRLCEIDCFWLFGCTGCRCPWQNLELFFITINTEIFMFKDLSGKSHYSWIFIGVQGCAIFGYPNGSSSRHLRLFEWCSIQKLFKNFLLMLNHFFTPLQ